MRILFDSKHKYKHINDFYIRREQIPYLNLLMSLIWASLFRITTFAILITLTYFVVLVVQVYKEQLKTKPDDLIDLPVFSQIWYVPFVSAGALFAMRTQVSQAVRPIFKIVGKDK